MSVFYYYNLNFDKDGNHIIHTSECKYLPIIKNRKLIGIYNHCTEAIRAAGYTTYKSNFNGCHYCCSDCREDHSL